MGKAFFKKTADLLQAKQKRKRWRETMISLSLVVALVTSCLLIHPAITMERSAVCGQDEHTHTGECYEHRLVCEKTEQSAVPATEEKVLNCSIAVHEHGEECYDEEGQLICESEVHNHDDSCYEIIRTEAVEGHTHTDACYEDVLICGKQEHTHTEACYPKETEAQPETQAPETQAPETQAPETQAPETKAPETEKKESKPKAEQKDTEAVVEETETEKPEACTLTVQTPEYTIEVNCPADAEVPKNAVLTVKEIKETDIDYNNTYERADSIVWTKTAKKIETVRFFDLSILVDGNEIQPKTDISVKLTFTKPIQSPEGSEVRAIRLGDDRDVLETQTNKANGSWSQMTFKAKALTVYAAAEISVPETLEENSTEDTMEDMSEEASEDITEEVTEEATEDVTEESTEDATEELTEESTEDITEESTEESTGDATEETTEEFTEAVTEETTEASAEDATEVLTEESTEDATEELTEDMTEEDPETPHVLIAEGTDYTVEVTYTAQAQIPEGSELQVREIAQGTDEYDSYYQQAMAAVQEGDTTSISFARFFDISFVFEGEEIEPAAPVAVKITYVDAVEVPEAGEIKSVHFGDEPEVLNVQTNESNGAMDEVMFDAESFSVYGIVGTEAITADIITAAGQTYTVTVSYSEEAKIPADAKLKLTEVAEGNEDYQKALEAIIAEAEKEFVEAADSDSEPEAFDADSYKESLGLDVLDISIVDKEGNEVEPSAPVKVTIERKNLPDDIDAEAFENIAEIQHLNESTETPFLETVATAGSETTGDITVTDGAVKAEFETGSFSLYTVKWSKNSITVHFVDRDGNELTGITDANGNSVDGSSITISGSGSLDLSTYKKDGYTYANTRITGYGDTGLIIYPKFRANSKGTKLRYWGDGTNAPDGDSARKEFQNGANVYVIMDPVPSTSGSGSGSGGGSTIADLPDPETSKTLTNNHDGTYDLNLSITGKSASKEENKNINVLFVIDNSSSMGSGVGSRLENTKDAVKESAKALLDNNTTAFPKLVEVAAVSFDGTADDVVGWTNVQSTFDTEIGNISTGWGTNWEDGLKKALDYGTGDGDPTYVIFFTDGMPYGYRRNNNTYEGSSNLPAMMAAKDEARAIVNSGRTLYNIFAYGSDSDYNADYLGQLTDYAYNDNSKRDTYYKKAAEKDDVVRALAEIVDSITQKAGFEKVKITDGITGLTQSTVIHGQANAFTYYRSGGKNADGTEKYDSTANKGKGEKWTEAPTASYSATTGVTWDLASIGQLEDGVTYTVSFTVWPGQGAYDAVAKINNTADPKAAYDALDPTVKAQILFDEETGTCSLKTNTEAKAEYTTVKTSTEKKLPSGATQAGSTWKYTDSSGNVWTYVQNADGTYTGTTTKDKSLTYDDVPSISLDKTTMKVKKIWVDGLTNAADRPTEINFTIYEDDVEYKKVTLTGEGNVWEAEINIAPGIYVTPGTHGTDASGVLEGSEGHVYTISETSAENHYDFSTSPVKPMLNGRTTTDGDMIEYLTKTAWSSSEAALTATNTVKDGIYIYKKVTTDGTDEIDCDEQFTFKVTLKDAKGNPVYTSGQGTSGDLGWRIDKKDTSSPDGYAEVQRGYIKKDGTVTLTMDASGRIRIVNVPVGTTFTVEEVTAEGEMPAGYEYYNSQVNSQAATTDNKATGTTVGNTQWATTITNKRNALSVDLLKVDNANTSKTLEGAEFSLFKEDGDGTTPATDAEGNAIGTITSGADGKVSIGTLLAGNYVLQETKAPAGYNLMSTNVTITVSANNITAMQGTSQCEVNKSSDGLSYTITVTNSAGVELPMTGGTGTLPYTLGGLMLIIASALMYGFRTRRRERRLN